MGSKPFWQSLTFWGLVIVGAIEGAEKAGVLPEGTASEIGQIAGMIVALYGRIKATRPLSITK